MCCTNVRRKKPRASGRAGARRKLAEQERESLPRGLPKNVSIHALKCHSSLEEEALREREDDTYSTSVRPRNSLPSDLPGPRRLLPPLTVAVVDRVVVHSFAASLAVCPSLPVCRPSLPTGPDRTGPDRVQFATLILTLTLALAYTCAGTNDATRGSSRVNSWGRVATGETETTTLTTTRRDRRC